MLFILLVANRLGTLFFTNKLADFLVKQVISSSQNVISDSTVTISLDKKLNCGHNCYANACLRDKRN